MKNYSNVSFGSFKNITKNIYRKFKYGNPRVLKVVAMNWIIIGTDDNKILIYNYK